MKISILDQFAADAINSPAAVTGGGGKCKPASKPKTKSHHSNKCKAPSKPKSHKSHSGSKNHCGCPPPPPHCS